jgi:DNA primase
LAGFIPEDKIAEIRNTANVVDVVSQYVALRKAGKNSIGLCPFHAEKTPSFTVNEAKQIFHCFGCGQGGNVFNFLMLYHSISFPEAVRLLAQRYGIDVPTEHMSEGQKRQIQERETLFDINENACTYYRDTLLGSRGGVGRRYLEKRKIDQTVIDQFELGFAPNGWENLTRFFSAKGISLVDAEKAGLVIPKKGGYYDRFRSRIIFPIRDVHGKVVAFGGRSLDDSLPKYLNSPETPVYHKGRSLYGLVLSKDACRKSGSVYVVEGYFDLLALQSHGVANVVATLGTALTKEHIRILKGYAEQIVVVFDSDAAGVKAAERSLPLFTNEKVNARVLSLPEGHDPDSFVRQFGGEPYRKKAEEAMGIMEFLMASAIDRYGLSLEGKARVVEAMKGLLGALEDGVARSLYVKSLAERLDIDETAILERVRSSVQKTNQAVSGPKPGAGCKLEETLVAMMLHLPEVMSRCDAQEIIDGFETNTFKEIAKMIMGEYEARRDVTGADLMARTEDPEIRNLISSLSMRDRTWDEQSCLTIVRQYQNQLRSKERRRLSQKIKAAEKAKDETLVLELLAEKQRSIREDNETLPG